MSRNILITGASSGFGRDTAETLSRAGHRVFASMRDIAGRNRPHADALEASGAHVIEVDGADALNAQAASIQAQVLESLGLAHLAEPKG